MADAPTKVTRGDVFARGNLVTVKLNGNLIDFGLVFADSDAGVIQQEMSKVQAAVLGVPETQQVELLGRNRILATRTGMVAILVKAVRDENFTPSTDGNAPWPEAGRPNEVSSSPPPGSGLNPWAQY